MKVQLVIALLNLVAADATELTKDEYGHTTINCLVGLYSEDPATVQALIADTAAQDKDYPYPSSMYPATSQKCYGSKTCIAIAFSQKDSLSDPSDYFLIHHRCGQGEVTNTHTLNKGIGPWQGNPLELCSTGCSACGCPPFLEDGCGSHNTPFVLERGEQCGVCAEENCNVPSILNHTGIVPTRSPTPAGMKVGFCSEDDPVLDESVYETDPCKKACAEKGLTYPCETDYEYVPITDDCDDDDDDDCANSISASTQFTVSMMAASFAIAVAAAMSLSVV